jgi:hypothetical protein
MGAIVEVLLVTRIVLVMLLGWVQAVTAGTVDASRYDAFWLWAGVGAQPVLRAAHTVYVLQGQIESSPYDDAGVRIIAQGTAAPVSANTDVWLVYRAHTLHWSPRIRQVVLAQRARWLASGRRVIGIQIDFDARTRHLDEYLSFLRDVRAWLPPESRLSITGLLDWSSRIDAEQINQLKQTVDEVVVQTYQRRSTIPDYAAYLPRVARLQVPFRIGLAQGGEWDAPSYLAANPWFRGYVVFLLNPDNAARRP